MITAIRIKNFKSFKDFKLEGLNHFTCIIGLNGSGKSTLLQVFRIVGALAHGEPWSDKEEQEDQHGYQTRETEEPIFFEFHFSNHCRWTGIFNLRELRFESETIDKIPPVGESQQIFKYSSGLMDLGGKHYELPLVFPGSILAHLDSASERIREHESQPVLQDITTQLKSLKSLGVLSPSQMRRASREAQEIEKEGEKLPGYLSQLTRPDHKDLNRKLNAFYGRETRFMINNERGGWKSIRFNECGNEFTARHANDGLVRLLAILSQQYTPHRTVLFDEIENGFNQELIEKLVNTLLNDFKGKQVIVTTHSSVVINYLPDDVAKESVVLFYKDKNGHTHATRFFEIPQMAELLEIMGPGQVMSRTNLETLLVEQGA